MAKLSILVPEATTNYIRNPALRIDTTGWHSFRSATISRSYTYSRHGIASLKVVTPGTVISEGAYYRVNELVAYDSPTSISVYVRGAGKIKLRLNDNSADTTGAPNVRQWDSKVIVLNADRWQRVSVPGYCAKSDNMALVVMTYGDTPQAVTFYIDGAQMELKPYSTSYVDGFQPGCHWDGLYDSSTSTRSAYTREGGKWVLVSGPDREREDIYMTVVTGLGVAPIANNRQVYSMSPGGYLDNVKILERPISLLFHVKHESIPKTCKDALSLEKLHELRQMLIDIIKPDRTAGNQPFWIEYQDGDIPLYMKVHYDGGLEGDWDIRNQWVMDFPLRLLALSPMMYEDNQENFEINFTDTATFNDVVGKIDGEWNALNGGVNSNVRALAVGKNGEVYAGGTFTSANSTSPAASVLAYFDGTEWVNIATAMTGTNILALAVAPDGTLYAGGTFTVLNGVNANYIAKWDGTTWTALGTGLNSAVNGIAVAPNGDVYAVGDFTTAGGISRRYIARWDGSSWQTVGAKAGLNDVCYAVAVSKDGKYVYVGGSFTDQYTLAANALLRIAKYTVSTNAFSAMGNGFNTRVNYIKISDSNVIYVGGQFILSGIAPMLKIAKWNNSTWEQVGSGFDGNVNDIAIDTKGNIVAVGAFSNSGDLPIKKIALWNGSTWVYMDININFGSSTITLYAAAFKGDDLYFGGSTLGTLTSRFSGITYVTNPGTAEVRPTFYFKGYGNLRYIENQTTGAKLWFNLKILENEEVFLDLGNGRFYSSLRGDLFYTMLQGSDFHAFTLLPGVNKISALKLNDVNALVRVMFTPVHWSADGTKVVEAF
ncbi:MAG: hypothetical protein KKH61_20990 [Gammaproteobacteria bacterium]|nr:hypothetical protein [Gammaproteobacteria bacterium]